MLGIFTWRDIKPTPDGIDKLFISTENTPRFLTREGTVLNISYQDEWNHFDTVPLIHIPDFLITAFLLSEDKRFYSHHGIDWQARFSALITNISHGKTLRGASTISEQVIKMIQKRPRTIWSRWIEGWNAVGLERRYNKDQILQFYLNQLPYASQRRGIVQAARYYFNRDLTTLSRKEMMALAVLVRAPSRLDLYRHPGAIDYALENLADSMIENGYLTAEDKQNIMDMPLGLERPHLSVHAPHFLRYARGQLHERAHESRGATILTTLNGQLQNSVQVLLDQHLKRLQNKNVQHAGVLVMDHQTGDVLVWATGNGRDPAGQIAHGEDIDAVLTSRQPGSSLKPFLYALALEKGWTAATIIDDSPLTESVGTGLHSYQNYSRRFYGPLPLREALGNSLNIPALKTLQFVGMDHYQQFLQHTGFETLNKHPNFYGDGLALGNGEVSLYQMVRAYAMLAHNGRLIPPRLFLNTEAEPTFNNQLLKPETAHLIGHILSDPHARSREFGRSSILNFPIQTAVKTGTSSDYRDSWAIGYNHRFVAGVWIGNFDQTPTDGITGSTGPALLLRSVFAKLNQNFPETSGLPFSKELVRRDFCADVKAEEADEKDNVTCKTRKTEWFTKATAHMADQPHKFFEASDNFYNNIRIRNPAHNLHMAYNPRLPKSQQAFEFVVEGVKKETPVSWTINSRTFETIGPRYLWPLEKGKHIVSVKLSQDEQDYDLGPVTFFVR